MRWIFLKNRSLENHMKRKKLWSQMTKIMERKKMKKRKRIQNNLLGTRKLQEQKLGIQLKCGKRKP